MARSEGWQGEVLAKLKTKKEFRSGFTYENEDVIHVFPGKISNVFDVEDEVLSLLNRQNLITQNGYSFVQSGVIQGSRTEIQEKPLPNEPNTGNLQTFFDLLDKETREKPFAPPNPTPTQTNSSFDLQCFKHAFESAAMLGASLLARAAYFTTKSSLASITTALSKETYRAQRFFSSSNKNASKDLVAGLPQNSDKSHAYEKENLVELPRKHKIKRLSL